MDVLPAPDESRAYPAEDEEARCGETLGATDVAFFHCLYAASFSGSADLRFASLSFAACVAGNETPAGGGVAKAGGVNAGE